MATGTMRARAGRVKRRVLTRPAYVEVGSWAEATAGGENYDGRDVAEVVARKTAAWRDNPTATDATLRIGLAVLHAHRLAGRPVDVLDFGGAAGAAFYDVTRNVADVVRSWTVVETDVMREAASPDGRLRFAGDIGGTPDLAIAQGVLQYLPDPLGVLRRIVATQPAVIVLSRTPMTEGRVRYIRQRSMLSEHGPGPIDLAVDRPVMIGLQARSRSEYLSALDGYRMRLDLAESDLPISGVTARYVLAERLGAEVLSL